MAAEANVLKMASAVCRLSAVLAVPAYGFVQLRLGLLNASLTFVLRRCGHAAKEQHCRESEKAEATKRSNKQREILLDANFNPYSRILF